MGSADRPVKRALLSVYDKTGIVPFALFLANRGVELVSTGGTAKAIRDAGIDVIELSDYTGYPEMLSGRVKTLHPKVHGGLLYMRGNAEHEATVKKHGIEPIDIVVVNLYPFEKVAAKPGATTEEIIENIDIGGPSMLRSASKNYASVAVVTDPADYESIIEEIATQGGITPERRKALAGKAFARTAAYDSAIAAYFGTAPAGAPAASGTNSSDGLAVSAPLVQALRYGENPHQKGALYGKWNSFYKQLQGKELSYNNILDLTAAAELIAEFNGDDPTVAILKHTNPCGVGQGATLLEAWRAAMEGVTLGMNYGLRRLAQLGVTPAQIRATGGGARSKVWRQIMADIFDAEVVTLKVGEGAAYGAALQALWCWRLQQGDKTDIADITDEFVEINKMETVSPKAANTALYRELQELQDETSKALRGVFSKHRQFVLRG